MYKKFVHGKVNKVNSHAKSITEKLPKSGRIEKLQRNRSTYNNKGSQSGLSK